MPQTILPSLLQSITQDLQLHDTKRPYVDLILVASASRHDCGRDHRMRSSKCRSSIGEYSSQAYGFQIENVLFSMSEGIWRQSAGNVPILCNWRERLFAMSLARSGVDEPRPPQSTLA